MVLGRRCVGVWVCGCVGVWVCGCVCVCVCVSASETLRCSLGSSNTIHVLQQSFNKCWTSRQIYCDNQPMQYMMDEIFIHVFISLFFLVVDTHGLFIKDWLESR